MNGCDSGRYTAEAVDVRCLVSGRGLGFCWCAGLQTEMIPIFGEIAITSCDLSHSKLGLTTLEVSTQELYNF